MVTVQVGSSWNLHDCMWSWSYLLEVSKFLQNPDLAPNRHRTKFSLAQHQAQHSYLSPASSPAVYPFSITLFILSPAVSRSGPAKSLPGPVLGPAPGLRARTRHIYYLPITYKELTSEFFQFYRNWPRGQVNFVTSPLPISLLRNMKIIPVSHRLTETIQFFQDHSYSPHLWWSGCNWWSGATERSSEVTISYRP